jgi:hypothetical protein
MARELEASTGVGETNAAFGWQAHASVAGGRVAEAHEQFRRGIQMSLQGNFREVAAHLSAEDAEMHAVVGQCGEARSEASGGLELSRDNLTLERAGRAFALCGGADQAASLSQELARQFPEATLTVKVALPAIAAALAIGRGEPARALELLEPARPYDRAPASEFWVTYLRGQAHLELKDGRAAAAEFNSIVSRQGEVPGAFLYPLAHLGAARAAVLLENHDAARKAYEDFFALWKDGDADLQPLREARREYSRLR